MSNNTDFGPQFLIGTQLRSNAASMVVSPFPNPVMFDPKGPLTGPYVSRPNITNDDCSCPGPSGSNFTESFNSYFQELLVQRNFDDYNETKKIVFTRSDQLTIDSECSPPDGFDIGFNDNHVCLSSNATEL